jgi:predicted RNA-binding Zn ribbon-like protein
MFQLLADHPALDFVNTLDNRFSETGPDELLPAYADLLRFAAQSRLLSADQARKLTRDTGGREAQRVLASAIELREALAAVLYARKDGAKLAAAQVATQVPILERHFQEMAVHRALRTAKSQLVWSWAGQEQQPEIPLWKLAEAASDLLVSTEAERVKECGDPTCRWLFLDTSKNHTRRWCDMKVCGNRMKARRFQARAAGIP